MSHMLVKGAFTGIEATLIDGKTLHVLAKLPIKKEQQACKVSRELIKMWRHKHYLIIDEMLMVACNILARISSTLTAAKKATGAKDGDTPFGGINVILVGNFHQFPPVGGCLLYWKLHNEKANTEDLLG